MYAREKADARIQGMLKDVILHFIEPFLLLDFTVDSFTIFFIVFVAIENSF